ncbi:protein kinase domain-containing protein [Singulisphaera sp. PoT]|uniref:protein kinase domain-containing protein n=1 Tax=Singulisphaera sp. PoT TaxID=3411797 RepID=UPI003BF4EEC3
MNSLSSQCDPDRLRLLMEDRLPAGDVARLEVHLETCDSCRSQLDQSLGDDRWLSAFRQYVSNSPDDLQEHEQGPPISLDFLDPSDWPDSLGKLGNYEIKGVLGRGGMGIVLKAFDPALHRNVAIKVLSPSLATSGAARRRFLREARAAAAVVHEHVVAVYAVVESSGLPFLVMEYVPGRSLQERMDRQGALSLPEILRIGMQTASGLAAAHAQGLVHRDIKPANILLEDGVERVRLTDFGLARAAADAALTRSGIIAGTPYYMSPEQAKGETADPRSDLFSLGSTLYAACVGHPPFRAESPLAVLRRVCDDAPRPIREQNPDVPPWLDTIIARLLAKDPTWRFQSAAEVAEVFSRCLAHVQQPLASDPPPPEDLEFKAPPNKGKGDLPRPIAKHLATAGWVVLLSLLTFVFLVKAIVFKRGQPMVKMTQAQSEVTTSGESTETALEVKQQLGKLTSEEIQRLLVEGQNHARSVDSELFPRQITDSPDLISQQSARLLREAVALEREIVGGHSPTPRAEVPSSTPKATSPNRR